MQAALYLALHLEIGCSFSEYPVTVTVTVTVTVVTGYLFQHHVLECLSYQCPLQGLRWDAG